MSAPELAEIVDTLVRLLEQEAGVQAEGSTDLVSELALESVQIMGFVTEVEDHYDVAIELEALAEIRRLEQLAAVVAKALQG